MKKQPNGFTLIELLVALTILVIVITTAYASFRAGLAAYRAQEENNILHQNIREALFMISRDVRSAYVSPGNGDIRFTGKHEGGNANDSIAFVTCLRETAAKEGGLAEIGYYVDDDPATPHKGLVRMNHGFPAGPVVKRQAYPQEIAPLATSLKLRYYDGADWQDEWKENTAVLPASVEVTVTVAPEGKTDAEQTFKTVVPVIAGETGTVQ
jgi:type II secretion system protein J